MLRIISVQGCQMALKLDTKFYIKFNMDAFVCNLWIIFPKTNRFRWKLHLFTTTGQTYYDSS